MKFEHQDRIGTPQNKKGWSDLPCYGCGKPDGEVRFRKGICTADPECIMFWYCMDCNKGKQVGVPDVWYGYGSGVQTDENICNPETGQPIPFYDKTSKAAAMKQAGVVEAGDRFHGGRSTFTGKSSSTAKR